MLQYLSLFISHAITRRGSLILHSTLATVPHAAISTIMPETRECTASGKQAQDTFETQKAAGNPFILEGIALDATEAEAARPGASKEAKEGLVYNLDAHSTVKRGQNKHQTDVYPPTLRATAQNPHPPALNTLALQKITYTNRAMILHFGTLFFMVSLLTVLSDQCLFRLVAF